MRCALNAYGNARVLTLQGRATRAGHARRGVVAGCFLATTAVQLYGVDPLAEHLRQDSFGKLRVYIDDYSTHFKHEDAEYMVKRAA